MKVLIDTNVLVSAVLLDRTPETVITYVVGSPQMQWVVSDGIMQEYKSVLARDKFGLPLEIIQRWYQLLDEVTLMQPDAESVSFPRDQTDAKFLTTALSARADFLITGDRDFVEAQKLIDTIILSVSQLLRSKCQAPLRCLALQFISTSRCATTRRCRPSPASTRVKTAAPSSTTLAFSHANYRWRGRC